MQCPLICIQSFWRTLFLLVCRKTPPLLILVPSRKIYLSMKRQTKHQESLAVNEKQVSGTHLLCVSTVGGPASPSLQTVFLLCSCEILIASVCSCRERGYIWIYRTPGSMWPLRSQCFLWTFSRLVLGLKLDRQGVVAILSTRWQHILVSSSSDLAHGRLVWCSPILATTTIFVKKKLWKKCLAVLLQGTQCIFPKTLDRLLGWCRGL